jgi:tetratricopeptide (TPR) repeat protein
MLIPLFAGYVLIHKRILPHTSYQRSFTYIENPLVGVHWFHKIPLAFSTVWFYISKMIFPKDLACYYGYNAFNAFPKWTDFAVIAGILLSLVLFYLIIKNFRKKTAFLFILLLFAGTAFPYTDIFQVGAGIVAERFMFIPSVAFIFLITYLLFYILKLPVDKKPFGKSANYMYAFTLGVCVLFAARVISRNTDWKSHQSVYYHDSMVEPNSAKLQSLLGATYLSDAQNMHTNDPRQKAAIDTLYVKAQRAFQKSLAIYPEYGTSWNNLGMIEYTIYANAPKAIIDFSKALKIDSGYVEAWFNLGTCYEVLSNKVNDTLNALRKDSISIAEKKFFGNETKESLNLKMQGCKNRIDYYRMVSEKNYLQTIKLKPTYYVAYIYISRLYSSEAQYHKVVVLDSNAIKYGYLSDPIYVTLGNAYLQMKDSANAVLSYEESTRYYTRNYYVCGFLESYYAKHGEFEKARYYKQLYEEAMDYKNHHTQ